MIEQLILWGIFILFLWVFASLGWLCNVMTNRHREGQWYDFILVQPIIVLVAIIAKVKSLK